VSLAISPFALREAEALQGVASRYKQDGYEVVLRPSGHALPKPLSRFRPDLVARGPHETVIVEVKSRSDLAKERHLAQMARTVERIPGWRFEMVVVNPEVESSVPLDQRSLTKRQILRRLDEAAQLHRDGHGEAASLLAWSALEAALRHRAQVCGVNPEGQSALSLAKSLYSVGEITKRDFEEFSGGLRARNALIHGFRVGRGIRTSLQRLTTMAKELLSESETE
jgi:hypothetical protein